MFYGFIGTLLAGVGVVCLYVSWKRDTAGRSGLTATGWLLLVAATACWVVASGAEFGISVSLLMIPLFAWAITLIKVSVRQGKAQTWEAGQPVFPGISTILHHGGLLVASVFLAGAAAILLSVAVASLLPWTKVNAMVTATMSVPVLWGLASYWVCADTKKIRPVLWLAVASGLSALFIYL